MADISHFIHNIKKGRDLEFSLSGYGNQMLNVSNRLSGVRFVLNYATFYETLLDGKEEAVSFGDKEGELPAVVRETVEQLNAALKVHLREEDFSGEALETRTADVDAMREKVIRIMSCLTALSDRYTMFEYVINRKEALFTQKELPASYSDEAMEKRLMSWLASDKDLTQMRLIQLIEQLPMRMTKSRFFQVLENGLSVYAETEKKGFEDELEMIRSSISLTEPEDLDRNFPELNARLKKLEQTDFEGLDAESFASVHTAMLRYGEELNNLMSLVALLAELINDLYVQILSAPYAMAELTEKTAVTGILNDFLALFDGGITQPVSEELYERFVVLEGKQESLYESFDEGISALDEITAARGDLLQSLMLEKIYRNLSYIGKLLSGSLFVSLAEERDKTEICGKEYVMQAYAGLRQELTELFGTLPRYRVRAVMAKVVTFLPPFLLTQEEVQEYIRSSLSGCKDIAEKTACVEILEDFLADV